MVRPAYLRVVNKWDARGYRPRGGRSVGTRGDAGRAALGKMRQVSKFHKSVVVLALYLTLYLLAPYLLAPYASISFIRDELRIGNKYVFMFLVAPYTPVFSDAEGAEVFTTRQCGRCFITNNKGMLPMRDYDAVLVFGDRSLLSQTMAVMDPGKNYLIEAHKRCVRNKLRGCHREPRVTSFSSRETFDLCGLCRRLVEQRA